MGFSEIGQYWHELCRCAVLVEFHHAWSTVGHIGRCDVSATGMSWPVLGFSLAPLCASMHLRSAHQACVLFRPVAHAYAAHRVVWLE